MTYGNSKYFRINTYKKHEGGGYNGSSGQPNQILERVTRNGLASWPIPAEGDAPVKNL